MEIKICGITNLEDRNCVIEAGADYFGAIVGFERSPRSLTLEQAVPLFAVEGAPGGTAGIRPVAVTVNMNIDGLRALYDVLHPFAIQLHGEESHALAAEAKRTLPCEIWKTFHIPAAGLTTLHSDQLRKLMPFYLKVEVDALLFDTAVARGRTPMRGGTGQTFSWALLQFVLPKPRPRFFIAGGLNSTNVTLAIQKAQPNGIDVSSGVEVYPGKKHHDKIRSLIGRVRNMTPIPPAS